MKDHIKVTAIFLLAFLFSPLTQAAPERQAALERQAAPERLPPPAADQYADFAADLEAARQALHIPGMAAAVVKDQHLVWAGGFGFADEAAATPVTADTPFHLASVTKPIAATLIMQLVAAGDIDLDAPVSDYGLVLERPDITVRHLLNHTSEGVPGTQHNYNGDRYAQLALVIEGATGRSFGELLQEQILTPAAMTQTAPNPSWYGAEWTGYLATAGLSRHAWAYRDVYAALARPYQFDASYENIPGSYPMNFSPAAGLLAPVTDLARFDVALDRGELLAAAGVEAMFTPSVAIEGAELAYGLGWYTETFHDTRLIWHSGGWSPSVSALYLKVPDEGLTFIILANNYNLTAPFPVGSGDVMYSLPALAFYRHFVYPQQTGAALPWVDWSAEPAAIKAQLAGANDPLARELLDHELWSLRKSAASVGDTAIVSRLYTRHSQVFPDLARQRRNPLAVGLYQVTSDPYPVTLRPDQEVAAGRVLFVWYLLAVGAAAWLVLDRKRRQRFCPFWQFSWGFITLVVGLPGYLAYRLCCRRTGAEPLPSCRWQAVGAAFWLVSVNGLALFLTMQVLLTLFPTISYAVAVVLPAMLLASWLFGQTPLTGRSRSLPYPAVLLGALLPALAATVLSAVALLPVLIFTGDHLVRGTSPVSPYFWIGLPLGLMAAFVLVYPLQFWLARREQGRRAQMDAAQGRRPSYLRPAL